MEKLLITKKPSGEALQLTDDKKVEFFNLAANERGEIPVDIYDYLLESEELLNGIRAKKNDERTGKK